MARAMLELFASIYGDGGLDRSGLEKNVRTDDR
jgi:hypothetical protein